MAMRYSRFTTWAGAIAALAVMTILSTLLGHMAPLLIPKSYTHYAAAVLFLVFGVRMLREAKDAGHSASGELEEVELELAKKQDVEAGDNKAPSGGSASDDLTPRAVLLQAFTLTFLAEWGDRSQIATIALATAEEPFGVTLGTTNTTGSRRDYQPWTLFTLQLGSHVTQVLTSGPALQLRRHHRPLDLHRHRRRGGQAARGAHLGAGGARHRRTPLCALRGGGRGPGARVG